MPNVEYIASANFTAGNGTSITGQSKPTGTEIGHCVIVQMYIEHSASLGSYTIASTGDTWTLVDNCTNTGATPDFDLYTWISIVGSATSTISITWDGTNTWRDFVSHTFANVDETTPEDCASTNNTGNSAAETGLSVTTATDGAHLVMLPAKFAVSTRSAWTSGLTERNDSGNVAMASGVQLVAGASGNKTNTITSGEWGAVLMALRPATGIINFGGFETGDFVDAVSSTGTVSIASAIKRSGNYSLRINPTAGAGNAIYNALLTTGKAAEIGRMGTTYVSFYMYFTTLPAAACAFIRFRDSAANEVVRINVGTGGEIYIIGTTTSADITTISTGTWYRMDMRITGNGTCGLKVDGGTETTLTGNNFTFDRVTFGPTTSHTLDAYIDDWAISDAGAPTTPKVTMAVPTGSGNYSSWTDGTGSTYAEVDEVPHDSGTTYLQRTAGTGVAHTLAMQDTATIGATGTIAAVKAVAIMAEATSTTTLGGVRLRSGSEDRSTISVDLGNTTYVPIQRVFVKDPSTSAAWTSGGVDAIEVGPVKGTDSSSIQATAVYAMVLTDGVFSGTAAATFPGLTASASGTHTAGSATGTAAATFPALTAAASGTHEQTGTAAATFPGVTAASTGAQDYPGAGAATFPGLTAAASGAQAHPGAGAATFPSLTASATGVMEPSGTAAAAFPSLTALAAGTQEYPGTAAATFPALTAAASGTTGESTGTAAATFPSLTASATGVMEPSGTAAATFPSLAAAATGEQIQTGTAAATFPALTAAASGSTGEATGAAAATFPSLTASATGTMQPSGTVAATFPAFGASATGTQTQSGTGAATLPGLSAAASGTQTQSGSASAIFPGLTVSLSGTQSQLGVGAATFPSISLAGSGTQTQSGTAAATFPSLSVSLTGYMQPNGTGAMTFPYLDAVAVGTYTQSGSATPAITTITGSDTSRLTLSGSDAIATILDGSDGSRLTLSGSETFATISGSDTSRVTVTGE